MKYRPVSRLILAAGLAFSGCATTSSDGPPPATAETQANGAPVGEDEASSSVVAFHQHHQRGGISSFVALSLDTLGAEPEKRVQIEKIQSDLNQRMGPVRDAEKNLIQTLADGVAAGTIDPAKVDPAVVQLSAAASGVHEATTDALNQLHAALSPAERAALADKVQAHWEVWRQVNHEAEPGGREAGGRLATLTTELSLTPDQVEKIANGLHAGAGTSATKFDPKEADAHVQAFAAAFAADSFDAKSLSSASLNSGNMATHGATRMVHFYEAVTPVLTADQRTKLADELREHLNHPQTALNN